LVRPGRLAPKIQGAKFPARRSQGQAAKGAQPIIVKNLHRSRVTVLLLGVGNEQSFLSSPDFSGRRIVHSEFHPGLNCWNAIKMKCVQAHHVARGIVKDQAQVVEVQNGVQATP
jgi:hypothetical protein